MLLIFSVSCFSNSYPCSVLSFLRINPRLFWLGGGVGGVLYELPCPLLPSAGETPLREGLFLAQVESEREEEKWGLEA